MPLKLCADCGRITQNTRCPEHQAAHNRRKYEKRKANGQRTGTTAEYRAQRVKALARAGHRCQWLRPDGSRCTETAALECHHINGDHHDHRLVNLLILCHADHMKAERQRRG